MEEPETIDALVVGGGPAGLMAAEALAAAGRTVVVAEAKPTVGRKLLMAGKSGLNLTKAEAADVFAATYRAGGDWLAPMLAAFGPDEAAAWAAGLGIATFTGSSGRVFPVGMKASPLLRAWLRRLEAAGVAVRTRWRWTGWDGPVACFDTPEGPRRLAARVTVLALGGASWARLGSDGAWAPILAGARAWRSPRSGRRTSASRSTGRRRWRGTSAPRSRRCGSRPAGGASRRSSSSPRAESRAAASMRSPTASATARR